MLHDKNQFNITQDARLITIVGQSASGLAAFYAALTNPKVFGNAIALSPSLEMQKINELEQKIEQNYKKNIDTQFIFGLFRNSRGMRNFNSCKTVHIHSDPMIFFEIIC